MRNPDRIATAWHALLSMVKRAAHSAPLLAVLLVVALGIAPTFQSSVVQAQDAGSRTGQRAAVTYALEVATQSMDRVCLRQTTVIPVTVRARVAVAGEPDASTIQVTGLTMEATSQDSAIVTADIRGAALDTGSDMPFAGGVSLTAVSVGSTSVSVDVTVRDTQRSGSANPIRLHDTIPVRVVPCEFRVDVLSFWVTTMYDANALISAQIINARLTSTTGQTFTLADNPLAPMTLRWDITVNRIRGCEPSHITQKPLASTPEGLPGAFSMTGQIVDDELLLNITYNRTVPGMDYYLKLCPRAQVLTQGNCQDFPDAVCDPGLGRRAEWFEPATLDVTVPITGGTGNPAQRLDHAQGSADGGANVIVTPVRVQ